ncbi:Fis family transcriptional regulator [Alteromonas pelagimontana]|uniref:Fis family transcriptional regulator n=1 Tax=Alteromonas pelagimontana TaxID=1858656 RepID=A0A6M4MHE6_9ALTE|nr:Fis family transcriptional regulator [Alteromonas pelagimontana]QJR82624.1 Fis family transcriptional regulator [Alteromonas pelagimontana]
MNKTIKKLDNNVVKALTQACETAKQWDIGFEWLTHTARYNHFPGSLMVTCVFSSENEIQIVTDQGIDKKLRQLIQGQLLKAGIRLQDIRRHVRLDSEERCVSQDNGDWKTRLSRWSS